MIKRLIEKLKALRIYAVMCSLSKEKLFDVFALITIIAMVFIICIRLL